MLSSGTKLYSNVKDKFSNVVYGKKEEDKKPQHKKEEEKKPQLPKQFSYQELQNGNLKLFLHAEYELPQGHPLFDLIIIYIEQAKQKKHNHKCKLINKLNLEYFPSFEFALSKAKMEDQKCTICLCEFQIKKDQELIDELYKDNDDDIYMLKCSHMFHLGCLKNLIGEKDWTKCPICSTIFGVMKGDQPDGTMTVHEDNHTEIPGHGKGVITINYKMRSGSRNGVGFAGTSRTAYLPNNKEGKEVLELFREAFNRKLIFTVGRSVTSGLDNQTVWNGIHHKTSINGGVGSFGYPDATYLTRVKEELAAKGITLESIRKN